MPKLSDLEKEIIENIKRVQDKGLRKLLLYLALTTIHKRAKYEFKLAIETLELLDKYVNLRG